MSNPRTSIFSCAVFDAKGEISNVAVATKSPKFDLEEVLEAKVEYSIEEVKAPSDSKTVDGGAKQSTQRTSVLRGLFGG